MAHSTARRRAAVSVIATFALTLTLSPAMAAPGDDPTIDQSYNDAVDNARTAEQNKAGEIASIETQLVGLQVNLDKAQVEAQTKAEDYNTAVVNLEAATKKSAEAAAQLAQAEGSQDKARVELGQVAAQMFKSNGQNAELEAILSAKGLEDVLKRTEMFAIAGQHSDSVVQRYRAATLIAESVKKRADEAKAQMATAEAAAKEAFDAAKAAAATATKSVADAANTRTSLLTQLASLKQTTLDAEQARQTAIENEQARRREEAARQEYLRQEEERRKNENNNPAPQPVDPGGGDSSSSGDQASAAVAWALAQVGKPYVWGASGPNSFDCSGLTSQAWKAAGTWITRTSRSQYQALNWVSLDNMRPGDLVFWANNTSNPGSIYHVAMYIGNGQIVEAPYEGVPVRVRAMSYSGGLMPYAGRP